MERLNREEDKRALILRLKRVEGQLRGLQHLIESEAPCESIAQQLSAARRALDKAFHVMVACMVDQHVTGHGRDKTSSRTAVEQLTGILSRYS
ncbi:MAG: metal-sensing transcriptional repressor [Burkholderiales bacterium]